MSEARETEIEVSDQLLRETEEKALLGDRSALEALKVWWMRVHPAQRPMFEGVLGGTFLVDTPIILGDLRLLEMKVQNESDRPVAFTVYVAENFIAFRGRRTTRQASSPGSIAPSAGFVEETIHITTRDNRRHNTRASIRLTLDRFALDRKVRVIPEVHDELAAAIEKDLRLVLETPEDPNAHDGPCGVTCLHQTPDK